MDLVIATASLAFASLFVQLPRRFERTADILGAVILVLVTIIVVLVFYLEVKLGGEPEPHIGHRQLPGKIMSALLDLHAMGTAPSFYAAVFFSLLMPFCQVVALWAMMRVLRLAAVLHGGLWWCLLVINLGVSLAQRPANVGSYQFFCVLGLSVFDVEKTTATGFSIFAFIALTLPFVFLGFRRPAEQRTVASLDAGGHPAAPAPAGKPQTSD